MDATEILKKVEETIKTKQERDYFLIHVERYRYILEQIGRITLDSRLRGNDKRMRILDVGCFPYHLGAAMEMIGHDVYGISSSHEPMDDRKILLRPGDEAGLRRDNSPYAGRKPATQSKIKICNIETDKFPFKDNFFDLVICTEVLEHLPQSPALALSEMRRVTMPQGHVLLTTPNITRSINRAKILLGKSVTYPLSQVLENEGKGSNIYHRHNREYTLPELTTLMSHGGWIVEEARHFVSYTPMRRRPVPDPLLLKAGKYANYFLMMAVSTMRDTLYVLGRKDGPRE